MIHIYQTIDTLTRSTSQHPTDQSQTTAQCNTSKRLDWVESLPPTATHIQTLVNKFHLPTDFVMDALDLDERPRIEQHGENTLVIIHLPFDDSSVANLYDQVKYRTIPFAMIVTPDHFITVCKENHMFNPEWFAQHPLLQHQAYAANSSMSIQATQLILQHTAQAYVKYVQHIESSIIQAEDELSRSYRNQELYTLLYLNESLLYVTTSLKQLIQVIRSSDFISATSIQAHEMDMYAQSLIELEQVYAVAEINQLNLNNVMDAYGNVIQNNVSHVVKLLTAVTIVLSIPTLIASVYGMNVPLPFQEAEHAFSVLIVTMVLFSGVIAFYFHKKRYF